MSMVEKVTTGLTGLDSVIGSLRLGDNVVLLVSSAEDYVRFARPFAAENLKKGKRVVYIRFASHRPVFTEGENIVIYHVDPNNGFEAFSVQIHNIIEKEGREVFYVFDCLSDLLNFWATDLMIGNFFRITCPYLFELDTVAYFAVDRCSNSFPAISAIRETTQVLLDVYEVNGRSCIHPLKVWDRYSPTIFLPHMINGSRFEPVTNSGDAADLLKDINSFANPKRYLDFWDRMFLDASDLQAQAQAGQAPPQKIRDSVEKLAKTVLTRQERLLKLSINHFSLEDLLNIKSRTIGSGFIGGKALGMLLARKILINDEENDWKTVLEQQDSFHVGSDVFYAYLVQNNLWKPWMEQRKTGKFTELSQKLKSKLLTGQFSLDIKEQFIRMLEHFGQSPIIVRSSSLLEDGFGNAFAGKYESIFCINQGTLEERYSQFEDAVKQVFASLMSEEAVNYRYRRGLVHQDEQMALLIQRVSGSYRQQYFFPDIAGVGYSYNTYVWDAQMDPQAGMLRLVLGLGTRAVNRGEGDYARMAALDKPLLKPFASLGDFQRFSQQKADVLNLQEKRPDSISLQTLAGQALDFDLSMMADRDYEAESRMSDLGLQKANAWIVTFDKLLTETPLPKVMRSMLKTLEKAYQNPVDIEFTVNLKPDGSFQVNMLQCRPLGIQTAEHQAAMPADIESGSIFFQSKGNFMGGSIHRLIQRIIFVSPEHYSQLNERNKFETARIIGRLNRIAADAKEMNILLLGPGRWGSTIPSLGVPVSFSEIDNISVLGEMAFLTRGYAPEVSFGTHFFQDLVENGIFYTALFPERAGVKFCPEVLAGFSIRLPELLPECAGFTDVIKVFDISRDAEIRLHIISDVIQQDLVCYLECSKNEIS